MDMDIICALALIPAGVLAMWLGEEVASWWHAVRDETPGS